jgi:hypothetical protein
MKVFMGKDGQHMAQHFTVTELTRKIEEYDHRFLMVSFLSSPDLCNDMAMKN